MRAHTWTALATALVVASCSGATGDEQAAETAAEALTGDEMTDLLFSEDFTTAPAMTAVAGGTWGASGGRYLLSAPASASGGNGNISVHDTPIAGDFRLDVAAKVTGTSAAWDDFSVLLSYVDARNYAFASFNECNDAATSGLFKVVGGVLTQVADITRMISADTDYAVRLVRVGTQVSVLVNGASVASATDAAFSGGEIGFGSRNNAASFDALRVYTRCPGGAKSCSDKPGASTTGVPRGTALTRLDGDQIIDAAWMRAHPTGLPAGAGAGVMQNQDVHGVVKIAVPNFTLRRSVIRGKSIQPGMTDWISLVFVTAGDATADIRSTVVIEDCELAPTFPSASSTGIFGRNFTARRNNIHHVVDGFGLLYFTHVEGNWVHDLTYFDDDRLHTNGTHNDCVQLHDITNGPMAGGAGGKNTVVRNFLEAFIAQDAGTPATQAKVQQCVPGPNSGWDHQAMSAFMVNKNVSNTVTDNWIEGGYYPVNAGDGDNAGRDMGIWQRNRFDRMRYDNPGAYYGAGGSFDKQPRFSLVFKAGVTVDTGAKTANANRFYEHPTVPGVVANAEALVRYY